MRCTTWGRTPVRAVSERSTSSTGKPKSTLIQRSPASSASSTRRSRASRCPARERHVERFAQKVHDLEALGVERRSVLVPMGDDDVVVGDQARDLGWRHVDIAHINLQAVELGDSAQQSREQHEARGREDRHPNPPPGVQWHDPRGKHFIGPAHQRASGVGQAEPAPGGLGQR
jgi:hypothetical protein